jgi:hypothetical protein
LAHRIACDNQAIYVQDPAMSGLGLDPVGEVGGRCWCGFWKEKAPALPPERGGDQWLAPVEPAVLGVWVQLRQEALAVRSCACTGCGITHDRDLNAARTLWLKVYGRRRAGADPERSWRRRQSRTCPSGCLWKREPANVPRGRHGRNRRSFKAARNVKLDRCLLTS